MSCYKNQRLLSLYCDAISAVNRELAAEIHLPVLRRIHTNAAWRRKQFVRAMLDQHRREHGCGAQYDFRTRVRAA